ncbi:sigma-70 family RNA polymerase sigma factor [Brevibacillus ruminantium]|uniref:Sigma-70 family RNA polymerase sigma factor n=1 Tax=Brevibacillus ruminantium TaxID=2950604 RepID=A0ABY4WEI2_9BACL|nr:sigma-70 family RNA polymerase sigma factor [Brevibacillus ruminantium]USG65562.1 sigma-70 family RNA polymerase sigma factor [Brevibacillus ruminantium]
MEKSELEQLIQEIQQGDWGRFEQVIDHFQKPMFTYCYHMLGHRQEAEDAVQEILIIAYERLGEYTYTLSFSAWLYKVAYHHCISLLRKKRRNRIFPFFFSKHEKGEDQIKERIDQHYLSEPLHQLLDQLNPEERNLIILRVLEQKGYDEIAQLLESKPATLRKRYERAIRKCRRYWHNTGGLADGSKQHG